VLDAATDELIVRTSATKRSADFIALLGDLDRRYGPAADAAGAGPPARPVVLVLDHGSIHTSKASRAALAARPWLAVEWLPKYAPELNAIERCWRDLKRHYLANQTFAGAADLERRVHQAVRRRNLERTRHLWPNLPKAA
jgi:transposase